MRKRYTAEQREKLIAEVRATGERVSVVAKRMGVSPSAAYLWLKEPKATKSAAPIVPTFARVVAARASSLRLEVAGAVLTVENGFDAELLRQVVAALSGST